MRPSGPPDPARGYLNWSRDPAVGLFAVLPLWLAYELLRLQLTPAERNGAAMLVTDTLSAFGPNSSTVLRATMALMILVAAWSILRRRVPWARVALVSMLEGTFYGLMLGPATGALTVFVLDWQQVWLMVGRDIAPDIVSSLGAGIFEEALFRLGLLSVCALAFGGLARAMGISPRAGLVPALLVSAVLFSWFHHVGPGHEEFAWNVFVFRAAAGLLLGLMFVFRGFAVCVYAHAVYDLHYYLTNP
ncbi:MAG: CPBP family intramembrane metalloprotease [Planctomycetes bacterium]|nr:CPBP family intramembrane metalloprotease [Planctomycetota bacterium]